MAVRAEPFARTGVADPCRAEPQNEASSTNAEQTAPFVIVEYCVLARFRGDQRSSKNAIWLFVVPVNAAS